MTLRKTPKQAINFNFNITMTIRRMSERQGGGGGGRNMNNLAMEVCLLAVLLFAYFIHRKKKFHGRPQIWLMSTLNEIFCEIENYK